MLAEVEIMSGRREGPEAKEWRGLCFRKGAADAGEAAEEAQGVRGAAQPPSGGRAALWLQRCPPVWQGGKNKRAGPRRTHVFTFWSQKCK